MYFLPAFSFLFYLMLSGTLYSATTELYVSAKGKGNTCSLNSPCTLMAAQEKVRKLNQRMSADIIVYIRGGLYTLTTPLSFSTQDSGNNGFSVIYKAYRNEQPIFSGGKKVTGWTLHEKGIYKARVEGPIFRQLYLNGQRMTRARTPNKGKYNKIVFWDTHNREIGIDLPEINNWKEFGKVELIAQMQWAEAIMRLQSFDVNEKSDKWVPANFARVKVQEPEAGFVFTRVHPNRVNGQAYHFENAYEFLDEPGEWYLDNKEGILYLKPPAHIDIASAEVVVPQLETLLKIEGTLDKPVHHLQFTGLTFLHSNWEEASQNGFINLQAGQFSQVTDKNNGNSYGHPARAIHLAAAHTIVFVRNTFSLLGATAMDLYSGVRGVQLVGNVFADIAGNGISVGKFFDKQSLEGGFYKDERELCKNNRIANNIITRIAQDYYGAVGVVCGYVEGMLIEHNEISYMPFTGVSIGWGWTKKLNASRGNIIRFNHIHHVMQMLEDGGAIYTLSNQPDSQIYGNYIHDVVPSPNIGRPIVRGIYLDEGSGGITIGNNAIEKSPIEEIGFHMVEEIIINQNCCQGYNKDIRKDSGLEPAYADLLHRVY
jgi:hypothetical protein